MRFWFEYVTKAHPTISIISTIHAEASLLLDIFYFLYFFLVVMINNQSPSWLNQRFFFGNSIFLLIQFQLDKKLTYKIIYDFDKSGRIYELWLKFQWPIKSNFYNHRSGKVKHRIFLHKREFSIFFKSLSLKNHPFQYSKCKTFGDNRLNKILKVKYLTSRFDRRFTLGETKFSLRRDSALPSLHCKGSRRTACLRLS